MSLVVTGAFPVIFLAASLMIMLNGYIEKRTSFAYEKAGGRAE